MDKEARERISTERVSSAVQDHKASNSSTLLSGPTPRFKTQKWHSLAYTKTSLVEV